MDQDIQQGNFYRIEGSFNKLHFITIPMQAILVNYFQAIALVSNFSFSASGCPIAAKNKGKSGYEGISSLSKYGPSSSTFGAFDQSTEHMMSVDDKDKNRMDTSDPLDEKV